jgi:hypothetical protein
MDVLLFLKQLADIGFTPVALIFIGVAWRLNGTLSGFDTRLQLLEQKTGNCDKC